MNPNDPRGAFLFTILKKLQSVGFSFFKFKILEKNIQHEWRKHGVIFRLAGGSESGHLKGGMCVALRGGHLAGRQLEDNSWLYATRLRKAVCNRLNTTAVVLFCRIMS